MLEQLTRKEGRETVSREKVETGRQGRKSPPRETLGRIAGLSGERRTERSDVTANTTEPESRRNGHARPRRIITSCLLGTRSEKHSSIRAGAGLAPCRRPARFRVLDTGDEFLQAEWKFGSSFQGYKTSLSAWYFTCITRYKYFSVRDKPSWNWSHG